MRDPPAFRLCNFGTRMRAQYARVCPETTAEKFLCDRVMNYILPRGELSYFRAPLPTDWRYPEICKRAVVLYLV